MRRNPSSWLEARWWQAMMEISKLANEPLTYNGRRHCPHCTALSRLIFSFLDPRHGNTVHVYQCVQCGKHIWDEGPKLVARSQ
jgi:Zn ribbon nucleic-acid-binding protein